MTVRVVTDSAGDLPAGVAEALGIVVVPLSVRFGDEEVLDGVDLSPAGFWARYEASPTLPTTAAPPAGWFARAYAACAAQGASGVVCVTMAAELSGTLQSATIAAADVDRDLPVVVVDSRSVSLGEGLVALAAAEAARAGHALDEVAGAARSAATRTRLWGALDSLDSLRKGGRLSGARATVAGVLSIKPLIEVHDGRVVEAGRQRTRRKALDDLLGRVRAAGPFEQLAVLHASADDVDSVAAALHGLSAAPLLVAEVGAVIGSHVGRGALGVAGLTTG